jgi:hypothetical protein
MNNNTTTATTITEHKQEQKEQQQQQKWEMCACTYFPTPKECYNAATYCHICEYILYIYIKVFCTFVVNYNKKCNIFGCND